MSSVVLGTWVLKIVAKEKKRKLKKKPNSTRSCQVAELA
jgi:hypothetical protein